MDAFTYNKLIKNNEMISNSKNATMLSSAIFEAQFDDVMFRLYKDAPPTPIDIKNILQEMSSALENYQNKLQQISNNLSIYISNNPSVADLSYYPPADSTRVAIEQKSSTPNQLVKRKSAGNNK